MPTGRRRTILLSIVATVALAAGVVWYAKARAARPRLADTLLLVDVHSGDRYRADVGGRAGVVLPATSPRSGEALLFPVVEVDGGLEIAERYRSAVRELGDEAAAVQGETWRVVPSERPVRLLTPGAGGSR